MEPKTLDLFALPPGSSGSFHILPDGQLECRLIIEKAFRIPPELIKPEPEKREYGIWRMYVGDRRERHYYNEWNAILKSCGATTAYLSKGFIYFTGCPSTTNRVNLMLAPVPKVMFQSAKQDAQRTSVTGMGCPSSWGVPY